MFADFVRVPSWNFVCHSVYHRRADSGNNQITSLREAADVCSSVGGRLATADELVMFMNMYGLTECGIGKCGYCADGKAYDTGQWDKMNCLILPI
jgi:hypothetical protein